MFSAKHESVLDVRGKGLLLGMKLRLPSAPIVSACLEKGYLINGVQEEIIRFAPPLIVGRAEIDGLMVCLDEVIGGEAG